MSGVRYLSEARYRTLSLQHQEAEGILIEMLEDPPFGKQAVSQMKATAVYLFVFWTKVVLECFLAQDVETNFPVLALLAFFAISRPPHRVSERTLSSLAII